MLRSLFILMLVGLMAAVGFYYENQAGESLADQGAGKDSILVAATAVRKVPEPERISGIDCESLDSESPDCGEKHTGSQPSDDFHQDGMDEESNKPLPH
jgi:hypothetical protein